MFQLRIVIKNIELFNFENEKNLKLRMILGKNSQETNIQWNYGFNNIINYRFIFDIEPSKNHKINISITNHSLNNHNQYIGYGKLPLSGIKNIMNGINLNDTIFLYNWDEPIKFNKTEYFKDYNNKIDNSPGILIDDCILKIMKNKSKSVNEYIGNLHLKIIGIKTINIEKFVSGQGSNEPNQYPHIDTRYFSYSRSIKKKIERDKIKIWTENNNYVLT